MRTILMTAYAVNPYKGSEEGTGWNLIFQVAQKNRIIAVTRKNNKPAILQYKEAHPELQHMWDRMEFLHFDLPKWMLWWKKGPLLSALYFYMWQFFVAIWLLSKKLNFDIAHSLNFHSNWTPSFLWLLGKPFVWGPVGNHPAIPIQYIKKVYGAKAFLKDRMLWMVKWVFWNLDPFVYICKRKAVKIFCVNTQAAEKLRIPQDKVISMPAVASEETAIKKKFYPEDFTVLSVGRFVPLKGFDLTILSFSKFYHNLTITDKQKVKLVLIGAGPQKSYLQNLIEKEGLQKVITIQEWMPRSEVIAQFKKSAVYLFPSHEGAGMVVAEAMSYGLPVVCLHNYGPGEYIHPSSYLRVRHAAYDKTIEALAERLSYLYCMEDYYEQESDFALAQFQKIFKWSVKATIMNQVYENILPVYNKTISTNSTVKLSTNHY